MSENTNYENYTGLILPFSQDAEQSVLGAILIEPGCYERVLEYLKPESFYLPQNRRIFEAIGRLFSADIKIDFVTILDELKRDENYDEGEGRAYLASIAQLVPSVANAEEYAKIVREKYYARLLIKTSKDIIDIAQTEQESSDILLDTAEQRIYDIRQGRETTGLVHIREVIANEVLERLSKLDSEDRSEFLGIPTGFKGIDNLTTGLNRSDLIVLAARPGVGKTSLALNIATNAALKEKRPVAVFSFEMSREQLAQRILSTEAKIPSQKFKVGQLTPDEWARLAEAGSMFTNVPLYIDETMNMSINQMKAKLRRIDGLGLVVIDYLQLMGAEKSTANRVQQISEFTRNLKMLAKELNVPVLVLSQLARQGEQSGRKPVLTDLRDSGSIEQDADIVMFIHRESMSTTDEEKKVELKNDAELIIAKNRHGSTGSVELRWDGEYTRFTTKEVRYDN